MTNHVTIHNWSTTHGDENPYQPPEVCQLYLQGQVYGHPKFENGDHVVSSYIVDVDGRIVSTSSGRTYRLGRPDQKWLHWLKSEGRPYNKSEPIKRRKS